MKRYCIVVTGTLGFDYIMDFPGRFADRIMPERIHQISLSFLVERLEKQFGGVAGNIGYSLKLLGCEPLIVSSAGNDFSSYHRHLKHQQISTAFIHVRHKIATGAYFVVTDQDDNQIGSFFTGAGKYNVSLSLRKTLMKAAVVVIGANTPEAMEKYIRECIRWKAAYFYDPSFQIDHFKAEHLGLALRHAKVFIGNDYEVALVEKKLGVSQGRLLSLVPIVVTTLGSKGSKIATKREILLIPPAHPLNTSDPTGAGDAYRAGFLAGYVRGLPLAVCGRMGSVAAVYTVEKYGTQTHRFTLKEFQKRYKDNFGELLTIS